MTYFTSPTVTDWQKQIIMGTILGGSSVVKPGKGRNSYLFMRSKNREWLCYKAQELINFSSQRPFTQEGTTIRWHSNCFPLFNEYKEMFFKSGKKMPTMEILDQLKDIGLAIWYGDAGFVKANHAILNTNKFGKEGSELIVKYFNEVGIEATLFENNSNYKVKMSEIGTDKLFYTIAHRLPEFMHIKLKRQA